MGILNKALVVGAKVAIVGGAVKVSIDQGVWTPTPAEGSAVLATARRYVVPGTLVYPDQLPSAEAAAQALEPSWNSGVSSLTSTLEDSPNSASKAISNFLADAPPQTT